VIDTQVVLNVPKRYDFLKILIKYVIKYKIRINYAIKQPGTVGAGLVPVCAGRFRGRLAPVLVPVVPGSDRCLPVPSGVCTTDLFTF